MIEETIYIPKFPLNQFVDLIWIGKASSVTAQSSHHAALFTELIFNYKGTFQVEGQNIEQINTNGHPILISGLKTAPFQTTISEEYGNIGLLLKPYCYGILRQQLADKKITEISDILYETIFSPYQPNFKNAEIQLFRLFKGFKMDIDLMKFETYISSNTLQKGALKQFNQSLSITQKGFIQKFKQHYLLTPNQYVKLRQVNHAIQLMAFKNPRKLTDIGMEVGFYDQSHFIRTFKKFCGATPKAFNKEIKMK